MRLFTTSCCCSLRLSLTCSSNRHPVAFHRPQSLLLSSHFLAEPFLAGKLGFCTRSSAASFTACAGQHTMRRLCALSKPQVSGISGFAVSSRSGHLLRVVQVSFRLEQNSSAMVGSGCCSSLS